MVAAIPLLYLNPKTDWSDFDETPYARPEFSIGRAFISANGIETFWYFTLARWACIPLSLIGASVCYCWSRTLYGTHSGILALAFWCFCPNILGSAAQVTPDAGAAAMGVAAGYSFWRWLQHPDWSRAFLAGFLLGLSELTKSTWIVLFGLWPLLWVISMLFTHCAAQRNPSWFDTSDEQSFDTAHSLTTPSDDAPHWRSQLSQLVISLLFALYILNLGYGFEKSFQRLDQFRFISHALGGPGAHQIPGNRFCGTLLGAFAVPVPANYLCGIDVQRHDFEVGKWSYLRGEQKFGGWWYYYFYALAVKVPIGTLLLFVAVGIATVCKIGSKRRRIRMHDIIVLAPAMAILILVSSQTGFSRYLRYILPIFPFVFIWTSQIACICTQMVQTQSPNTVANNGTIGSRKGNVWSKASERRFGGVFVSLSRASVVYSMIIVVACSSIISSLLVCPHSISYFNELAGGPHNGPRHLLDANIDWGQDLLGLKRWVTAHPDAKPLYLTYFGFIDPKIVGLEAAMVPPFTFEGGGGLKDLISGPKPGWHAISVNDLYGYRHAEYIADRYAYLRMLSPVAHAGYSIRIYHVTDDDVFRIQQADGARRFPEQPFADGRERH